MWILGIIIGTILLIGGAVFVEGLDFEFVGTTLIFIGFVLFVVSFLGIGFTTYAVANGKTVAPRLEMYQQENKDIEKEINTLVANFMEHESETFGKAKGEDSMALISLYPELKSDELVKEQIKLHSANKKTITKLKEEQINLTVSKWWLYFGK